VSVLGHNVTAGDGSGVSGSDLEVCLWDAVTGTIAEWYVALCWVMCAAVVCVLRLHAKR